MDGPPADLLLLCREGRNGELLKELRRGRRLPQRLRKCDHKHGWTVLHEACDRNNAEALHWLLLYGGNPNVQGNNGQTPLHVACARARSQCVKLLLRYGADVMALDQKRQKPRDKIKLNFLTKSEKREEAAVVQRLLKSHEVVIAAECGCDEVTTLLNTVKFKDFELNDLEKALNISAKKGCIKSVCHLLCKGVIRLDYALEISAQLEHYRITAILALTQAAMRGDIDKVLYIFGESNDEYDYHEPYMKMVIDSVKQHPPPLEVLICVAIKFKQNDVIYQLLKCIDCDRTQGIVDWSKLKLRQLEPEWMPAIASFVHYLNLSHNKLCVFQDSLLPLAELVRLNLADNLLETVPKALFQQAKLRYLDLSSNHLKALPNISSWSRSLEKLYLSKNKLRSLPDGMQNAFLVTLKLDHNLFADLPACVPCILTLKDLDLSHNSFLGSLPNTLGQLLELENFNLAGVEVGNVPAKHRKSAQDIIRYLRCKLRSAKEAYHMKIVVLGNQSKAKQLLVARLQGDALSPVIGRKERAGISEIDDSFGSEKDSYTQPNLIISNWEYKAKLWAKFKIDFSVWNFTGIEPYIATHYCFLTKRCLCLLVCDVTDGPQSIVSLSQWLDSLVSQAPDATVVVVAHTLNGEETMMDDRLTMQINNQWRKLIGDGPYSSLHDGGIVFIGNESDSRKSITRLRETIYSAAAAVFEKEKKRMKHLIPNSYLQVAKRISAKRQHCKQRNKCPIMTKVDVLNMLEQIPGKDIESPQEQREMVDYLNKAGNLMHFNIPSSDIHQLLFIDPPWLYELMSRLIYARPRSSAATSGILRQTDLPILFPCHRLSEAYHPAFLRLLNRYSIAIMIDYEHMLVPALLPSSPSSEWSIHDMPQPQLRRIYTFTHLAAGFWSRLLARLLMSLKDIAAEIGVDHHLLFKPTVAQSPKYKGQTFDFSSDSRSSASPEPANKDLSQDTGVPITRFHPSRQNSESQNLLSVSEVQYNWFQMEQVDRNLQVKSVQAYENEVSVGSKNPELKQEFPFQEKTPESVSLNEVTSWDSDTEFVSLPKLVPQTVSLGSERAVHYWRYGMSCHLGESFFLLRRRSEASGADQELEVITSANKTGQKAMALIVDIMYALLKEWFPELLKSPLSDFYVQQTVMCSECSRLDVRCVNNFCLETCIEACLSETPVKCHHHIKIPPALNDLVPDIMFVDLPDELLVAHNQLHFGERLGGSSNVEVFQGRLNDQPAAIKSYKVSSAPTAQRPFHGIRAETKYLRNAAHPNIVTLLGVCPQPAALVLELARFGSLDQYLSGSKVRLDRLLLFHFVSQITAAIGHLHSKHIVHRGITPRAVLVFSFAIEDAVNVKLCDFGSAGTEFPSGLRGNECQGVHQAPEIVLSNGTEEYDASVDMFSFAMLLYEMITYQKPFEGEEKTDVATFIFQNLRPHLTDYPVPEGGMYCLAELMRHCWGKVPNERPKPPVMLSSLSVPQCQCLMGCQVLPSSESIRVMCLVPLAQEVWVFAEESERLLVYVLDMQTLVPKCSILDDKDGDTSKNKVQCAVAVGMDTVWVGVIENAILIFNVKTKKLVDKNVTDYPVLSLATCIDKVFAGLDHGRLSVYDDLSLYKKGQIIKVGSEPILSVASIGNEVWYCCGENLYAIDANTLDTLCCMPCEQAVTELVMSPNGQTVWSRHRKFALLSCWSTCSHSFLYSFDCFHPDGSVIVSTPDSPPRSGSFRSRCCSATPYSLAGDRVLSVLPLDDTIWVGTLTGYILIFRTNHPELLTQFRAHNEKVRSLLTYEHPFTEHGVVLSGASGFQRDPETEIVYKTANAREGAVLMWEAIPGSNAKLLEQRSQAYNEQ